MARMLTVMRRELGAFFASPVFWVLSAGFLAFFGFVFAAYVSQTGYSVQASMQPLLSLIGTVLLFVSPLLSMRLLAEEQRSGTLEVLMTSPVHDWQVVLGKWLAGAVALVVMMAFTLIHVALMARMATNGMDRGELASTYLGILLLGGSLMAIAP